MTLLADYTQKVTRLSELNKFNLVDYELCMMV